MHSLEKEFTELNVSPPTRRKTESNTAETSDRNTAASSPSYLDLFIQDLDERKGKLPCCQEVTEIQTSVERFLKVLLLAAEKELPFYKTTFVKSGSFYEGTKVGKPDEFDYFVQLDNFSRPEDIRFEELSHCMVAVIPSDSAIKKLIETKKKCCSDSPFVCDSFEWKREVKSLFIGTLNGLLAEEFVAFGLKASEASLSGLDRHGPAYTLELEWDGGQLYKGLIIRIDLSIAVKINSHSSTMAVDFESGAGKVVKSLLDASPAYYFAVSGYTVYDVPPSNLFQNLEETQEVRILSQSDCLLRISQSCLEQSLFRDHFGPNGGPSVCLRVVKVLRDMTRLLQRGGSYHSLKFNCKNGIDETAWEFITTELVSSNWQRFQQSNFGDDEFEPDSTRWISSYVLKTLVLFEWSKNPEEEQWTGSNLSLRLVNVATLLLYVLKENSGLRSFWSKDYNVLPDNEQGYVPSEAINRVTIILRFLLS